MIHRWIIDWVLKARGWEKIVAEEMDPLHPGLTFVEKINFQDKSAWRIKSWKNPEGKVEFSIESN